MANSVGLVGVGDMGQGLLARLRAAGNEVKAFDIAETSMAAARDAGAETVASAAEAARDVPIVHVIVRSEAHVLEATLGSDGVLAGAGEGTRLLLHSTILPETTLRVAKAAAEQGVTVIDAPITAVPPRVHAGEATFLVGGPDDIVAELRPHLESLGRQVLHFGPLTSGNIAKIAKNLTNGIERVMLSEAVRLAEAGGLDGRQWMEMAKSISHGATITSWEKNFDVEDGHVVPHPEPGSILFEKDVMLAAALAKSLKVDLPLTQGTAKTAAQWLKTWGPA